MDENFIKVMCHLLPLTPNRDTNLKNEKGETALHRASGMGHLEVVKHLVANGVDQNSRITMARRHMTML